MHAQSSQLLFTPRRNYDDAQRHASPSSAEFLLRAMQLWTRAVPKTLEAKICLPQQSKDSLINSSCKAHFFVASRAPPLRAPMQHCLKPPSGLHNYPSPPKGLPQFKRTMQLRASAFPKILEAPQSSHWSWGSARPWVAYPPRPTPSGGVGRAI